MHEQSSITQHQTAELVLCGGIEVKEMIKKYLFPLICAGIFMLVMICRTEFLIAGANERAECCTVFAIVSAIVSLISAIWQTFSF